VAAGVALLALLAGGAYVTTQRAPTPAVAVAEAAPAAPATAPDLAANGASGVAAPATTGIAPSDEETRILREQGQQQLAGGDAERAASSSGRAAVNELLKLAIANMAQDKLDEAEKDLVQARARGPKEPLVYYNTAILRLKQGRTEDAIDQFEASFMAGFSHFDKLAQDRDLDALRNIPRFAALVKQYDTAAR